MYVALLEDEQHLADHICEVMMAAGHQVMHFTRGSDLVHALRQDTFELFVLDWRLPGLSGLEVLKYLRNEKNLTEPVIFLTSCTEQSETVEALTSGADDYCHKPLRPPEFLARVEAILRRTHPGRIKNSQSHDREFLGYRFSSLDHSVSFDGTTQTLSEKQFKLALFLFEHAERPVPRDRLLKEVWGRGSEELSRSLDVHISWIRRNLKLEGASKARLRSIYGFGYRLTAVDANAEE